MNYIISEFAQYELKKQVTRTFCTILNTLCTDAGVHTFVNIHLYDAGHIMSQL